MDDLHNLYSPRYWSKRLLSPEEVIQYHIKFIDEASKNVRAEIPCQLDVAYGPSNRQKLDIVGVDLDDNAPLFIYVHGGYWQEKALGRESYQFMAKNLHKNNIKSIFIGYELCPDVAIPEIVRQIEEAAKKCIDYAKEKGSRGVYFMGHSAGAHLVANLFTNFIKSISDVDQSLVKDVILAAGVFDLLPIQKTPINETLKMDEEVALKMSPLKQNLSNGAGTAFYLTVGGNESPAFIKQSQEFSDKLKNLGFQTHLLIVDNVDHFNLIERLSEEDYEFTKHIIDIISNE